MKLDVVRQGMLVSGLLTVFGAGSLWHGAEANAAEPAAQVASASSSGKFLNPGVYRKIVAGKIFEWIPTEDVQFEILSDGKVKIVAPSTKRSFNDKNDCRPFLYDHAHKRITAEEQKALLGRGLKLPLGNYGFAILWVHAESYDDILKEPWNLTDNPETFPANSAQVDYVNLSIVPAAPVAKRKVPIEEVSLPYDLQRVSWLPHYQVLPYDLKLPPDKGFGITRLLWDIPLEQVYRKVTHIQYMYAALDDIPASKMWRAKRAYDHKGALATNEWLIQDHSLDKDFITAAELDENFGSHGIKNHGERAQQVFEGIYHRFEKEQGVTSPNQTRLYDDYFSALEGYDNSVNFVYGFNAKRLAEGLSSQEKARRMLIDGDWKLECKYFAAGAYKYRNWMQGGYLDSFARTPEGVRIYNEIYNYERKFMAAPDRRVLKFGWSNAEGCNSNMFRAGTKSRLHFDKGDIIRNVEVAWPFHMMLNESFWALLLGHDYVLWHSSVTLVQDPYAFGDSWAAGAGKTQWQPAGGTRTDYDPKNPAHPQRVPSPKGQFPNNPHLGESGAFAGAWLVGQITAVSDRISKTIEYCPFSYKINGGESQSGYHDSNNPENGSLGNAKLSRFGVANFGQANIVKSYEAKKPICVFTEGADGAAVIYHNVYGGLTDVNEVTIVTPAGKKTFQVTGNSLHVFYLK